MSQLFTLQKVGEGVDLLPNSSGCLVCGRDNPIGLKLRFAATAAGVAAQVTPDPQYQGFSGVLHGGMVCALLDDALWYAIYQATGVATMTAELTTRYKRPVPCGEPITVRGRLRENRRGRLFTAEGGLYDAAGTLLAEGSGSFLAAPPGLAARLVSEFGANGAAGP